MPDEKKSQKKNDPKDQRRPKHGRRHDAQATEKKPEKKVEAKEATKDPTKPVFQEPGPEFYKNLKRETDEILKINEEESLKYKKKEIQSNWSKYEMPVESYDEIEEQENMGADYEKLIEAPLVVGGHFQFKHEKTWDTDTGPTPYDKYFEINMDNLSLALSTIPFHERNSIDKSIFTETDLTNVNNRATRYKQKYYSESKHKRIEDTNSPHIDIQQKILNDLKPDYVTNDTLELENSERDSNIKIDSTDTTKDINIGPKENFTKQNEISNTEKVKEIIKPNVKIETKETAHDRIEDDFIFTKIEKLDKPKQDIGAKSEVICLKENISTTKPPDAVQKEKSNPVIESPEDLEKWLDDFLDG